MAIAVFGLDGALVDPRRRQERIAAMHAPDWDQEREDFTRDAPIPHVVEVLKALHAGGHRIVILGDRPDRLQKQTKAFLSEWGIPYHELYFRANDDERPEDDVKRDLFERAALPGATLLGIFDANPALLAYWSRRGLPCFEVCAHGLA